MPGGLTVTNQQPQLGLGFPLPPTDTPTELRTLKERRFFGRSKGYRDLTLVGTENEKSESTKRSQKKNSTPLPSPSPRTTTLYAFGDGSSSDLQEYASSTTKKSESRLSPPKVTRTSSMRRSEKMSSLSSSVSSFSSVRDRKSIAVPPTSSPSPPLREFGHKLSMSTSFHPPAKPQPSPHKRTGTSSSLLAVSTGPSNTDKSGTFAVPAVPSRQKTTVDKLSISPSTARNKLSLSVKDGPQSRRTSFLPGATGLGARTISPTDATRIARRLSQPPPKAEAHKIIVPDDEPLPTLTVSSFERKFMPPANSIKVVKAQPSSRSPSPSPTSNRDSLPDSGIGSSASGTNSSGHPSPNTVFLEAAKASRRKSLIVEPGQNGVPPVPPIPKELSDRTIASKVSSAKTSPKSSSSPRSSPKPSPRYKSPPPPLPSQNIPKTPTPVTPMKSRDRGLTLSTSIPAYVSAKSAQTPRESRTGVLPQSLEPLNLPPYKLSALATPTVQKVNALVAKTSATETEETTPPHQRTVSTPQTAALTTRFPRGPRIPATPSLTPPIVHPSGAKTASAATTRRSIPSPGSLLSASRRSAFLDKHASGGSVASQVAKLPAHEEETESPKAAWRSVSRGTGKLIRRASVTDRKPVHASTISTPSKKEIDAALMPAPSSVPAKKRIFGLTKKQVTPAKDLSDRNSSLAGLPMGRQSSSSTVTPPPPRYSSASASSEQATDEELLGGNSKEMEAIIRSASSKYRTKIERDLEELEVVRRRVNELGDAGLKDPVTPSMATKIWGRAMSTFEKGEIVDYPNVWFCSDSATVSKTGRGDPVSISASRTPENATQVGVANYGFDDDIGNYVIVQGDHLAYRYEIVGILGKGSFGQVCKCLDHKTGKVVAVKIIRNKQRFHTQALVEVNILQKLCQWDGDDAFHLIRVTHHFYFRGHLCIATELLGMNLYELIKTNEFRGFPVSLIRKFARQILRCLLFLRRHRVVHCDLKPENILLVHPLKSDIKIIDFGSSCFENEKVYTYIQSRFYRSPEVILGMNYGTAIDMWSVGCILAELYTGYPLFPGENEQEQLACIMEVFGPPEKYLVEKSARKKLFFDSNGKPKPVVSSKGKRRRPSTKTLAQALNCGDELFVDFVARCMRWSPDARMTPEEGLQHPFIDDVVPKVLERRNSIQSKSMLPTPATFNGRTRNTIAEGSLTTRARGQTTSSGSAAIGGMSYSVSLPAIPQPPPHGSATRALPEVPKSTTSSATKKTHRLSNSITSLPRPSDIQSYGVIKPENAKSGLGIFAGPRRSTINSSNTSLSMRASRENTSLVGARI